MFLTYLMLAVALCLSAVAAFYSIVGLAAIFAAAVWPIVLMGSILEVAKLVVTVWLHEYWDQVKRSMRAYLVPAVGVLMLITSMGIFGFLSKAHLDQAVPTGEVAAKVAVLDEKIKTQRDTIDTARTALKQMDAQVDQILGRTTDEQGAQRAANLRRQQAAERTRLQRDISTAQAEIAKLNEQRAPVASELRKVEAEVGPIKYIAALIYGDNPENNTLEKAVRWVIIILVLVFDPLAVMMLLAATESMKWERAKLLPPPPRQEEEKIEEFPNDTDDVPEPIATPDLDERPAGNNVDPKPVAEVVGQPISESQWGGQDLTSGLVPRYEDVPEQVKPEPIVEQPVEEDEHDDLDEEGEAIKRAKRLWKLDNPHLTIKEQRKLFNSGQIDHLPWLDYIQHEDERDVGFGTEFPKSPLRGDMFVRVDALPTILYKYNGTKWMEVDKNLTDRYTYNEDYITHLIGKISAGQYDPELLSDGERAQLEQRLRQDLDQ